MSDIEEIYGSKIRLPNQPNNNFIVNYGLPNNEQKWAKKELPTFFDKVEFNKNGDLILTNQQEEYASKELDRIRNGIWIYINGKLRYCTGKYYFYLQYYTLEDGNSPDFREADRQYFLFHYHWHKIEWCYGIIRTKKRRAGASSQVCSNILYEAIFYKNSNCGLVSKSSLDGKSTFASMIVNSYRQLPAFLKPKQWNKEDSVSTLIFSHKAKKIEGIAAGQQGLDGNNSKIEWRAPAVNVFDSSKLNFVLVDEGGKMPIEVPLSKLLAIISKTLIRGVVRVGWIEMPSTTNDMQKGGGAEFFKVFKNADQFKKTPTTNRLVRFFQPAYVAFEGFIDEFGDSVVDTPTEEQYNYLVNKWVKKDEEGTVISELTEEDIKLGAKHYILNKKRDGLVGKELEEEIRMNPCNEEEAFMNDGGDCHFNSVKINKQRKYLEETNYKPRQVTFYRDFSTGKVSWVDDEKGYCYIAAFPPDELINKFEYIDGKKTPCNKSEFSFSIDSYANSQGGRKYGSFAAGFMYRKYNVSDPENTGLFVAMYFGRPKEKTDLHEQIMLMAEYYGTEAHYEFTSDDFYTYFKERGMLKYLGKFPKSAIDPNKKEPSDIYYGYPISPFAMTKSLDSMISYVESYCDKIYFDKLLEQLLVFEADDRTKSDAVVAASNTLVCSLNQVVKKEKINYPLIKIYS